MVRTLLPRLAQGLLRQLTPPRTAVRSCAARSASGGALCESPQLGGLRCECRADRARCTTSPRTGAAQLRPTATETTARGGGPRSCACSAATKRCAASGCLSLCHCRRELRAEELGSAQVLIADGQVSMGDVVFKSNVQKVRRFGAAEGKEGNIVAGFAGAPPPVTCCSRGQGLDQLG